MRVRPYVTAKDLYTIHSEDTINPSGCGVATSILRKGNDKTGRSEAGGHGERALDVLMENYCFGPDDDYSGNS